MSAQWENSRQVIERIFIRGVLVLETPAHLGNGDSEALTDIPILRDAVNPEQPLLTGTSIAGALRNYLREYEAGYGVAEQKDGKLRAEQLFGHLKTQEATVESWLMVDDSLGTIPANAAIEIRDGVAIDPATRTAEVDDDGKGKKFDIELLPAGTSFPLQLELWLRPENDPNLEALAIALRGLENGEIGLGMRKRRGYGQCRVQSWQVSRYKMNEPAGLIGWLEHDWKAMPTAQPGIENLLDVTPVLASGRESFTMEATFSLKGSLLIRSDAGQGDSADTVHLRSWRAGVEKPIVSGTSLAGVIRSRARRIARTLFKDEESAQSLIDGMFGRSIENSKDNPTGSRVIVRETEIENPIDDQVYTRVKLDRFTGGSYPGALFNQQPVLGRPDADTQIKIHLELRKTPGANFEAEVGLLLLALKDLWTGDLPIGGESSVGRGRLQGMEASLTHNGATWVLQAAENGEVSLRGDGDPGDLEEIYLKALLKAEEMAE